MEMDFMKLAMTPENSNDGTFPIFHHVTRLDQEATDAAGANVYKKLVYVEIIAPGNDKERMDRAVKPEDKVRWPEAWRSFEAGDEEPVFDGMPITEWTMADRHLAQTLKESNVFTVEQLANVADIDIQMLGPGMTQLKVRARKWVKDKEGENDELIEAKAQASELERKVVSLEEKLEKLIAVRHEELTAGNSEPVVDDGPLVKNGGWTADDG